MKLKDEIITWPGLHGINDAICRVQIFENIKKPGDAFVILTELPDNPGTSVTNGIEIIARQIARDFDIDPAAVWVEHYLAGDHRGDAPETFDLVVFDRPAFYNSPRWAPISWDIVRGWITDADAAVWADL